MKLIDYVLSYIRYESDIQLELEFNTMFSTGLTAECLTMETIVDVLINLHRNNILIQYLCDTNDIELLQLLINKLYVTYSIWSQLRVNNKPIIKWIIYDYGDLLVTNNMISCFVSTNSIHIDWLIDNHLESVGEIILTRAIFCSNSFLLNKLINVGVDISNHVSEICDIASCVDDLDMILKIEFMGYNVHLNDVFKIAIRNSSTNIAKFLYDNGMHISSEMILPYIADMNTNMIKWLIQFTYLDKYDEIINNMLINRHVLKYDIDIVKQLIDLGANVTSYNNYAISYATTLWNIPLVKLLIEANADINIAMMYASYQSENYEMFDWLIQLGADVNIALKYAALNYVDEFVIKALKYGADLDAFLQKHEHISSYIDSLMTR